MELRDEVRSLLERSHKQARRSYDEGDIPRARAEYLKCAVLSEKLAALSSPERKAEFLDRSKKFAEIADGLKEGTVKVYTSGIKPPSEVTPEAVRKTDDEKLKEKVKGLILTEKPKVKFTDIAGLEQVKENIKEAIVYPFKYPEEYQYFGVKGGGGILLYGPPGCGKTMLAAAAAFECEAMFISLKVSDIKDKYVGESEKNIKEVFHQARQYERTIIFFDEIDAVAGERSGLREGHEKSLVSEMLSQMDGLESKGAVLRSLVLAATNRPWDVDIALRRPGRFDTTVFIPHPDPPARRKILELSLKDKPLDSSVNLDTLARRTEGYASAEVVALCERAARIPLRERIKEKKPRRELTMADFERVLSGMKSVLPGWYKQALKELSGTVDIEMFQELIDAAREYSLKPRAS